MAAIGNYIQLVIRGLYNEQQWQVSPTYVLTDVDSVTDLGGFQFIQSSLSAWFIALWNGFGALPTNGLADAFAAYLPESASINEVRVFAKTNTMAVPEQAIIVGELNGTRGATDEMLPSYMALSCFARSLEFGRRGASMRLPVLTDGDVVENNVTEAARTVLQTGLLDPITQRPLEAALATGLTVYDPGLDQVVNVQNIEPGVVGRWIDPATGKPTFPYEGFANISAIRCAPWTMNVWASTQNSRKVGRGR